jgi:hypothetical protein
MLGAVAWIGRDSLRHSIPMARSSSDHIAMVAHLYEYREWASDRREIGRLSIVRIVGR